MSWSSPRTWVANELVTATIMNTYIRDNQNALKNPPRDEWTGEVTDTVTNATWTDIDATNLSHTITTTGGDVRVGYVGWSNSNNRVLLDVDIDGTRASGNTDGFISDDHAGVGRTNMSFVFVETGLSAASHTFKMQFKGNGILTTLVSTHFFVSESG